MNTGAQSRTVAAYFQLMSTRFCASRAGRYGFWSGAVGPASLGGVMLFSIWRQGASWRVMSESCCHSTLLGRRPCTRQY